MSPPIPGIEVGAIVEYMGASGIPWKLTSTTGGRHAPHSYHYRGLAADLAGPTPSRDSEVLMQIFNAFVPVEKQLAELIYARAPYNIKRGRRVGLYCQAIHHDHVHIAVEPGTMLVWPGAPANIPIQGGRDVVNPEFDPPLPRMVAWLNNNGGPGGWGLGADGGIFALGGAPFLGCMVDDQHRQHFVGRTAARLAPREDGLPGYMITATSGEKYNLP
jgi:hypothetical protein